MYNFAIFQCLVVWRGILVAKKKLVNSVIIIIHYIYIVIFYIYIYAFSRRFIQSNLHCIQVTGLHFSRHSRCITLCEGISTFTTRCENNTTLPFVFSRLSVRRGVACVLGVLINQCFWMTKHQTMSQQGSKLVLQSARLRFINLD